MGNRSSNLELTRDTEESPCASGTETRQAAFNQEANGQGPTRMSKQADKSIEELSRLPHHPDIVNKVEDTIKNKTHNSIQPGSLPIGKKKMDWIDSDSGSTCFMVYARELSITWSEEPMYWRWFSLQEPSGVNVDVAALENVCWLDVRGSFKTESLTPNHLYEVALVVKLQDPAYGWEEPVVLRLEAPQGTRLQERRERLVDLPRGRWVEIVVGSFTPTAANEVHFSLFEHEAGKWKKGLVVKGAFIRPMKK